MSILCPLSGVTPCIFNTNSGLSDQSSIIRPIADPRGTQRPGSHLRRHWQCWVGCSGHRQVTFLSKFRSPLFGSVPFLFVFLISLFHSVFAFSFNSGTARSLQQPPTAVRVAGWTDSNVRVAGWTGSKSNAGPYCMLDLDGFYFWILMEFNCGWMLSIFVLHVSIFPDPCLVSSLQDHISAEPI